MNQYLKRERETEEDQRKTSASEEREGVEEGYLCRSSCWLVWILVASERLSRGVRESNASLRERKASKRCERLVGVLCGLLS